MVHNIFFCCYMDTMGSFGFFAMFMGILWILLSIRYYIQMFWWVNVNTMGSQNFSLKHSSISLDYC